MGKKLAEEESKIQTGRFNCCEGRLKKYRHKREVAKFESNSILAEKEF